jgi:apolipoprotein N-acyltransferase
MNKKLISNANLLLLIFGLLNLFASGRWTVALAAWVASIFGLRYLHTYPRRRKYLFFYLVLWLTLAIPWYGATLNTGPIHFLFMAVNSLVAAVPYFLDSGLAPWLRRDGRLPFIATFTFPLAVTGLEFLTSSINPLGNFGAIGYSQYGIPVLTQITAVTGMLGLTFLVSWFPAVVNWAWDNGFQWQRIRAGTLTFAAVLLFVAGYGAIRLVTAPAVGDLETVPVASFTLVENHMDELNALIEEEGVAAFREETQAVHEQYLSMTESAIGDGARIILWPELAITGIEEDVQAILSEGQALAQEGDVYLAMPTFTLFPDSDRAAENVLYVAGPDGTIVLEHVKYGGNIVEGTLQGSGEIEAVDTEYGRLSGIICWDTNFPNIVRQVGRQNVNILLSPAKEWDAINPLHAEMAVFRALENGTAVIRQADEGLSIVVDGYGRTLASGEGLAGSGTYLLAEVPNSSPSTLYPVIGDVVGIIALVGLAFVVIVALIARSRRNTVLSPL